MIWVREYCLPYVGKVLRTYVWFIAELFEASQGALGRYVIGEYSDIKDYCLIVSRDKLVATREGRTCYV
jgi:hypothetical protein